MIEKQLENSEAVPVKESNMGHAYIITAKGEEHSLALTLKMTQRALCSSIDSKACGTCSHCQKVEKNIHPDVTVLAPLDGKKEISVQQIRELIGKTHFLPNEAERTVFIINPAQALNASGQNALLKTLEEPPGGAMFFLLCENPQELLPTIRSRCVLVEQNPDKNQEAEVEISPQTQELLFNFEKARLKSPLALMEFTVALEKLERPVIGEFIAAGYGYYAKKFVAKPDKENQKLLLLFESLQNDLRFHVSSGHMAGKLAASGYDTEK